jgi:hypothetical protein
MHNRPAPPNSKHHLKTSFASETVGPVAIPHPGSRKTRPWNVLADYAHTPPGGRGEEVPELIRAVTTGNAQVRKVAVVDFRRFGVVLGLARADWFQPAKLEMPVLLGLVELFFLGVRIPINASLSADPAAAAPGIALAAPKMRYASGELPDTGHGRQQSRVGCQTRQDWSAPPTRTLTSVCRPRSCPGGRENK